MGLLGRFWLCVFEQVVDTFFLQRLLHVVAVHGGFLLNVFDAFRIRANPPPCLRAKDRSCGNWGLDRSPNPRPSAHVAIKPSSCARATACVRLVTPSLPFIVLRYHLTVPKARKSSAAISRFERPAATRRKISNS